MFWSTEVHHPSSWNCVWRDCSSDGHHSALAWVLWCPHKCISAHMAFHRLKHISLMLVTQLQKFQISISIKLSVKSGD
jgi:hypothetical protein